MHYLGEELRIPTSNTMFNKVMKKKKRKFEKSKFKPLLITSKVLKKKKKKYP